MAVELLTPHHCPPAAGSAIIPLAASTDWPLIVQRLGFRGQRANLRKVQVLRGIWEGLDYAAIALRMGITADGVEAHWRHLKAELQVRTHNEIIRRIADIRADLHIEQHTAHAVAQAVQAATKPLLAEIETLQQRLQKVEERAERETRS